MQLCLRPCWSWYANSVKTIKSPLDNLALAVKMQSDWCAEAHLKAIAHIPTSKDPQLVRLLGHPTIKDAADKVSQLVFHLLRKRCCSFSKHSAPPDCYAQLFAPDAELREDWIWRVHLNVLWSLQVSQKLGHLTKPGMLPDLFWDVRDEASGTPFLGSPMGLMHLHSIYGFVT